MRLRRPSSMNRRTKDAPSGLPASSFAAVVAKKRSTSASTPSTSSRHTPYLVLSVKSTSRVQTLATPYTFLSNGFSLAT